MSPLDDRDLEEMLRPEARPEPPPGLLDALRRDIPAELPRGAAPAGGSVLPFRRPRLARRLLLAAASLVTVLGGGFLAWRVVHQAPPLAPAGRDEAATAARATLEATAEKAGPEEPVVPLAVADAPASQVGDAESPGVGSVATPSAAAAATPEPRSEAARERDAAAAQAAPRPAAPEAPRQQQRGLAAGGPSSRREGAVPPAAAPPAAAPPAFEPAAPVPPPAPAPPPPARSAPAPAPEPLREELESAAIAGAARPAGEEAPAVSAEAALGEARAARGRDDLARPGHSWDAVRSALGAGRLPAPRTVHVEELVAAFDYGDRASRDGDVALLAEGGSVPAAAPYTHLLRIAVAAGPALPGASGARVARRVDVEVEADSRNVVRSRVVAEPRVFAGGALAGGDASSALHEVQLRPGLRPDAPVATVRLRWQPAAGGEVRRSVLVLRVGDLAGAAEASRALRLASVVARFGELLQAGRGAHGHLAELAGEASRLAQEWPEQPRVAELAVLVARARDLHRDPP